LQKNWQRISGQYKQERKTSRPVLTGIGTLMGWMRSSRRFNLLVQGPYFSNFFVEYFTPTIAFRALMK
jgi:hypothetical protein